MDSLASALQVDAMVSVVESGLRPAVCYHCGLEVLKNSNWEVVIDAVQQPMCCPGCKAVASAIVDCGFGDYYRTRIGYSVTAEQETLLPAQLELCDAESDAADISEIETASGVYSLEGMHCAACVWLIERRLARLPGVQSVEINVANAKLQVTWQRFSCKSSDILKAVREIGYLAYPFDAARHAERLEMARKKLFRRLFVAGLSMMQVMMYALPAYIAEDGTMDAGMQGLMRWASLLLTLPAVLYSAQPFFAGALTNLRNRMLGMDVPVAIGIGAAFGASVVATVHGTGEVYFDSATMFIFLLLCSRYLELGARRKAAVTLDTLQHALPASAWLMPGYPGDRATDLVAAGRLRPGDVFLVKPGEAIAADGLILEGQTEVDLSLLSGESQLQERTVGASLPGGAINATQPVIVKVTQESGASTLSVLMNLIEQAGRGKPQLAFWADRVAAWFVAVLLLFAVAAFFAWEWIDPSRAWLVAIAVLVVSCPCALSLAMPTALAAATDSLQRRGALIVQPHVLETMQRCGHIVFDKTGTLTEGRMRLQHVECFGAMDEEQCLRIAAALEAGSMHPVGHAIGDAVRLREPARLALPEASDVRHAAGAGIQGRLNGTCYRIGNGRYVAQLSDAAPLDDAPLKVNAVYLGDERQWLARFDMADALRDDARETVDYFRAAGKSVMLLSGDRQALVDHIAQRLGIETAIGDCLPEKKLAYVRQLQREGATVAMVGDGVNDAAVLGGANVSFAMSSGASLAQLHADCVLLSGGLGSLRRVAETAARTQAVVRQNLSWAVLYNALAIPAAACGLLNPWVSAAGMSLSSALVVLNALRLRSKD